MPGFDSDFFDAVLGRTGGVFQDLIAPGRASYQDFGTPAQHFTDPTANNPFGAYGDKNVTGGGDIFGQIAGQLLSARYNAAAERADAKKGDQNQQQGRSGPRPGESVAAYEARLNRTAGPTYRAGSPEALADISLSGLGPSRRAEFFERAMQLGLEMEQRTGIPAEVFAAMFANESNFGNAPGNIAGGVKAEPNAPGAIPLQTWEMVNGQRVPMTQWFQTSGTALEGMQRVADTLMNGPGGRYAPAYQALTGGQIDRDEFLRRVNAAGYATNPNWAQGEIVPLMGEASRYRDAAGAARASREAQAAAAAAMPAGSTAGGAPGLVGGNPWRIAFDFAQRYTTPLPGGTTHHRGIDLVIPGAPNNGRGSTYNAFVPGTVVALTHDSAGGNGIIVQSADGLYQRYFHNDRVLVREGQYVDQNTPLGIVGATGTEGFPHLHFEVSRNINGDPLNQLIDPRPYLNGNQQ